MYRRCGRHGVGIVANVITLRGRSTMREIGKALNLPADVLEPLFEPVPLGRLLTHPGTCGPVPAIGLEGTHPRAKACLELFQAVHGLPRHLGQHSGGMVF